MMESAILITVVFMNEVTAGTVLPFQKSDFQLDHKGRRNANSGTDTNKNPSTDQPQLVTHLASFLEWDKWSTMYPNCNPKINQFTSPIDISASDAINAEEIQTLFVYSGEPERDTYLFSTYYMMDDYYMEALNIRLQGQQAVGHATIISGLGRSSKRFFDSALLLIKGENSKGDGSMSGGIHKIDSKNYPMEIVFTFKTEMGTDETQIHVMVEVTEEINPVWKPLTDLYDQMLAKVIEDTCFGNSIREKGKEAYETSFLQYTQMLAKQKEELNGGTYFDLYEELTTLYEAVKCCDTNKILELETQSVIAQEQIQKGAEAVEQHREKMKPTEKEIENLQSKIKQLKENGQPYVDEEEALNKTNVELKKLKERENELSESLKIKGDQFTVVIKQMAKIFKLWEDNKIGDGNLFSSVAQVQDKMNEAKNRKEEMEKAKALYENATSEFEQMHTTPSRSTDIKIPFQISWLFPPYGGHYFYNGSSPLPPCGKKAFVIVFEKAITISSEQLLVFQKIPSIHQHDTAVWKSLCDKPIGDKEKKGIVDSMDSIVSQVPIHKRFIKRKVWYNPKNLQYKMDDALHMKSSDRRKMKLALAAEENSIDSAKLHDCRIVILFGVLACLLSYFPYEIIFSF